MLHRPDSLSFLLFLNHCYCCFSLWFIPNVPFFAGWSIAHNVQPRRSDCSEFCDRGSSQHSCCMFSFFSQYFVWFRRRVKSIHGIKREDHHVLEPMRCRTQCRWRTCLLRNRNMSRIHQLWLLHIILLISRLIWIRLNFSILFISHRHQYHRR